jgi:phosphatidylserine decarboxylase
MREVVLATLVAWTLCALLAWAALEGSAWLWIPANLPLVVWLWVLWFFRDPERSIPDDEGLFLSPADGRVADITPIGPESALGRDGMRIGIFMNVFNVHVNRMPCDGIVEKVIHQDGAFLDVRDPAAIERNESTTIHLRHVRQDAEYPIVVRQVAGLVARRIVTCLEPGQSIYRGQRFGMIKFGSRLEVFLPNELLGDLRVAPGRKALAGQTVLAEAKDVVNG